MNYLPFLLVHLIKKEVGGLLLWEFETHPLRGSTINSFIQKVLLEEKASQKGFNFDNYIFNVKWTMDNETDLFIIVVDQKLVQLLNVDDLFRVFKEKFCDLLKKMNFNTKSMDYQTILKAVEEHSKKNLKTEELKKKPKKNEIIPESEKQKNEPTKQEEDSKKSIDPYKQKLEEMKQKKKEAEDKKKIKKSKSYLCGWLQQELSQRYYYTITFDQKNTDVLAYGGFEIRDNRCFDITCVAVNPKYQRKKFGEFLLLNLILHGLQLGCQCFFLHVKTDNFIAQSLYKKTGFKVDGFIKGYYSNDGNEDNCDVYRMVLLPNPNLIFSQFQIVKKEMEKRIENEN
eukprot:gene6813-10978_t